MSAVKLETLPPERAVAEVLGAIQVCRRFINAEQIHVMRDNIGGEEGDYFRQLFVDIAHRVENMPKVYAQESLGDQAVVHLHYFTGSADFYITERDSSAAQHQAFGLSDLYGDGGEVGYISILELIRSGVEFDLHWQPCTLAEVRKKREARRAPPAQHCDACGAETACRDTREVDGRELEMCRDCAMRHDDEENIPVLTEVVGEDQATHPSPTAPAIPN